MVHESSWNGVRIRSLLCGLAQVALCVVGSEARLCEWPGFSVKTATCARGGAELA